MLLQKKKKKQPRLIIKLKKLEKEMRAAAMEK